MSENKVKLLNHEEIFWFFFLANVKIILKMKYVLHNITQCICICMCNHANIYDKFDLCPGF